MHSYSQTNIQLFNQLRLSGYSNTDLNLIRDAYELAMVHFTGRFQPSGKSFIAHVVGTASILASLRLPPKLVAAALIHNIYESGDFGDGVREISPARRKRVASVVGQEVEEYVAKFPALYWEPQTTQLVRDDPERVAPVDRNVLMILLADHLEHLFDLDVLYYEDAQRLTYINNAGLALEIAGRLGFAALAEELEQAIRQVRSAELPVEFPVQRIQNSSSVIAPRSCRKRFSVALRQLLAHAMRSSRMEIQKLRLLRAELAKAVKLVS
jgi:(p)ppGpp synthase/HD superfamily hydrolase